VASGALTVWSFSVGLVRIFAWAAVCTPRCAASMSAVPASSWLSTSSALVSMVKSIASGSAARMVSVEASQLGLRTNLIDFCAA